MGKIDASDKNIKGIIFEVGGNMKLDDSEILADKDAVVGIMVRGNYESKNSKVVQSKSSNHTKGPKIDWQKWGVVVAIFGIIISIYFSQKSFENQSVINSPGSINTVNQIGNNTLVINENKQIPYSKKQKTNINGLDVPIIEMYDVKYILPNGQEALIPKLVKGEEYTLFYANDDYSDLYVPQEYRVINNGDEKICWLAKLHCNTIGCEPSIVFQSQVKTEQGLKECYKI